MLTYNPRIVEIASLQEAKKELELIGADPGGINWMAPKGVYRVVKLEQVPVVAANIIKQEMLGKGADAAVARGVVTHQVETTDMLLMGTVRQYQKLITKLRMQPFGLKKLADHLHQVLNVYDTPITGQLKCPDYTLELGRRTLVMGILNVTPDSFSDGGKFFDLDLALEHARQMVEAGADIIDLGGESTRPNYQPVPEAEEIQRVVPVIERLAKEISVPISIDTYKSGVARAAIQAGAQIVNDIWGFRADPDMAAVAAELQVPVVLMHNQSGTEYTHLMGDIIAFLRTSIAMGEAAGIAADHMVVDPGIGFGKTTDQNLEVMHRLEELKCLGKPILLGTSRKSIVGNTLNLPVQERMEGTGATVTLGIAKGADIVRIHDVKEMVRVVKMTDAMVRR